MGGSDRRNRTEGIQRLDVVLDSTLDMIFRRMNKTHVRLVDDRTDRLGEIQQNDDGDAE